MKKTLIGLSVLALLVCAGLSGLRSPRLRSALVAGVTVLLCLTLLIAMPARARTARYLGQFHFERAGTEVVASPDMSPARRAMYDFIRQATPPDAVVIDDPSECQQNTQLLEVPLLARRQLFTAIPNYWMTGGYAECPARMEVVRALYGGRPLTSPQRLMLRELNRPVFVLLRPDDPGLRPQAEPLIRSRPQEFTEGGLLIDFQERSTGKLAFRSWALGEVREGAGSEKAINDLVTRLLETLP